MTKALLPKVCLLTKQTKQKKKERGLPVCHVQMFINEH